MEPDFSGYVTKYGLKCSDGRTILAHAFKGQDGQQIPLVWQHQHNDPTNVLGHVVLQHRDDGVYASGFFNETPNGKQAKDLVKHKDINAMSIYANQLVETGKNVTHGNIREASLVLAGANPGALIDNVSIRHSDGNVIDLDDEVVIYSGQELEHAGSATVSPPKPVPMGKGPLPKPSATNPDPDHDGDNDLFDPKDGGLGPNATVAQVYNTLTPQQKTVVNGLIGQAAEHAATSDNDKKGDAPVSRNVFDQSGDGDKKTAGSTLSHSDIQGIFSAAKESGSLRKAVEEYALSHGIDDISTLFPYDQAVTSSPEWISRRMEWVAGVLGGTRKTPFARIRSWTADITPDEARAKGYIKANMKKEEFFSVARRITTPQTIYKKQKLDRDDIIDITDFDVVTWLQTEMRIMLDEELARAILIGDGREVDDEDKINESNIRPIATDVELYNTTVNITAPTGGLANATDGSSWETVVDQVVMAMRYYRGSGNPVFYTTLPIMNNLLLIKDSLGRRLYPTKVELAAAMGVSAVIPCEALEIDATLVGIIVNLTDYTVGADKGGAVNMFDFFDIDYNQFKYLIETRVSGAMTKYRGAITVRTATGSPVTPEAPTQSGNTVTVPTVTGVTYSAADANGTTVAISSGTLTLTSTQAAPVTVTAVPASGYFFPIEADDSWQFFYQAS